MSTFNVILIGAGEINFGSIEGPWNHSKRLEKSLGKKLRILSIIDPDLQKSNSRIHSKLKDDEIHDEIYKDTIPFKTPIEASNHFNSKSKSKSNSIEIHLIINGSPPHFRGSIIKDKNLDLVLLDCFPFSKGIFIEKPVSALRPDESGIEVVAERIKNWSEKTGGIVGVGYVLRYLKAVQKIRSIILQNSLTPILISARYYMAYEHANKLSWWNKKISCGPVIEQATHFVDLLRYFGGEVLKDSIDCQTVEWFEKPGKLRKLGFKEDGNPYGDGVGVDGEERIEEQDRIPRATTSIWKFEGGGIGQLNHVVGLHGTTYDTEFEIVADGWVFRLKSPYSKNPKLYIRKLGAEEVEEIFEGDDPFFSEIQAMVNSIQSKSESKVNEDKNENVKEENKESSVLSSFEDAMKTYETTWLIREKGEENVEKRRLKNGI